jgi:hypothetical protein
MGEAMSKIILVLIFIFSSSFASADFFGGDLPLLTEIVSNTLHTMIELQTQTSMLQDQMAGIRDHIERIKTIADVVQPSNWDQWKDPREALKRLQSIYYTLPKEYRSAKSDEIETELAQSMNLIARIGPEAHTTFESGKELERRGADASPGVAQKLAASGIGTLVSLEAQNQIVQSHIVNLLSQMVASGNDQESRKIASSGEHFKRISEGLGAPDDRFSSHVSPLRMPQ